MKISATINQNLWKVARTFADRDGVILSKVLERNLASEVRFRKEKGYWKPEVIIANSEKVTNSNETEETVYTEKTKPLKVSNERPESIIE